MIVYRKSIELVRIIHELVMPKLRRQDSELHQQLHRAVRSADTGVRLGAFFGVPARWFMDMQTTGKSDQ